MGDCSILFLPSKRELEKVGKICRKSRYLKDREFEYIFYFKDINLIELLKAIEDIADRVPSVDFDMCLALLCFCDRYFNYLEAAVLFCEIVARFWDWGHLIAFYTIVEIEKERVVRFGIRV